MGKLSKDAFAAKRAARGSGLKFNLTTIRTIKNFSPGTKIKYGPNPKSKGSKSFTRYAKYEKAKTVGEALAFGTKLADLCWELDRGHYKILGGARSDTQEVAAIGQRAFNKAKAMLGSFVGPRGLAFSIDDDRAVEELKKEEAWRDAKLTRCEELAPTLDLVPESAEEIDAMGIHECVDVRLERRVANALAEKKLKEAKAKGCKITDSDVTEVLELWGFQQNEGRLNVLPEGQKYVYSDTLGAIRRRTGVFGVTPPTKNYPQVPALLSRWLADNGPKQVRGKFVFSAINVNANYAAKRHRDQNNEGPSCIKAFGKFKGGRLKYWPGDSRKIARDSLDQLRDQDALNLDIGKQAALFDGNKAHAVEAFTGNRFSIVFFTAKGYGKISAANHKFLTSRCNFPWPTPKVMTALRKVASEASPASKGGA